MATMAKVKICTSDRLHVDYSAFLFFDGVGTENEICARVRWTFFLHFLFFFVTLERDVFFFFFFLNVVNN